MNKIEKQTINGANDSPQPPTKKRTLKSNKPFQDDEKDLAQKAKSYIRVGTEYYFRGEVVNENGEPVKILKKWRIGTLKSDHGPRIIKPIEKFIDFALVPDHTDNYQRKIRGCYNLYEPLKHKPQAGECKLTIEFLKHIFGDYFEVGLDWIQLLYTKPTERLPALCLVSKMQKTGKTTFLRWVCNIFGENSTILGNEDFSSNFNSSWTSKLIIGIDESFIEKQIVKEKIKRLVTDSNVLVESKGVDKNRQPFFGKFILNSNNEENFIQMEREDSRFFVLKVPKIEKENPHLEKQLSNEIPQFLHYISSRQLKHPQASRLWFSPEIYETDALKAVVKNSKSRVEKLIADYFIDLYDNLKEDPNFKDDNIKITPVLLEEALKNTLRNYNGLRIEIRNVLKSWDLKPVSEPIKFWPPVFTTVYKEKEPWQEEGENVRIIKFEKVTGRPYIISFDFIKELIKNYS